MMGAMTPNQPKTTSRNIRVPDERWERAKARAAAEGTTVSSVVNAFLEEWGSEPHGGDVGAGADAAPR